MPTEAREVKFKLLSEELEFLVDQLGRPANSEYVQHRLDALRKSLCEPPVLDPLLVAYIPETFRYAVVLRIAPEMLKKLSEQAAQETPNYQGPLKPWK